MSDFDRQIQVAAGVLRTALLKLRDAYHGDVHAYCTLAANEAAILWRVLSEHSNQGIMNICRDLPSLEPETVSEPSDEEKHERGECDWNCEFCDEEDDEPLSEKEAHEAGVCLIECEFCAEEEREDEEDNKS